MRDWKLGLFSIGGIALSVGIATGCRDVSVKAVGHYLAMEQQARAEFAEKASVLSCGELRLFGLTNYLGFLEANRGLLLLDTNDYNYEMLLIHGRLSQFYSESKRLEAERHRSEASNYFLLLRGRPMNPTFLETNPVFKVAHE